MRTQVSCVLLLLLACSFYAAKAQRSNIWNEPITFNTKARDSCTMIITGQGELTKLKLSCEGKRSYQCEYVGKPYTCRSYNKNPRHYFVQMMWGLRKLYNACQAPRVIKPHMCRRASDDAQMVFSPGSLSQSQMDTSRTAPKPPYQPRPQPRPVSPKEASRLPVQVQPRVRTTQQTRPHPGPNNRLHPRTQPTPAAAESHPKRAARLYCWRSLQGVCAFVIGMFQS